MGPSSGGYTAPLSMGLVSGEYTPLGIYRSVVDTPFDTSPRCSLGGLSISPTSVYWGKVCIRGMCGGGFGHRPESRRPLFALFAQCSPGVSPRVTKRDKVLHSQHSIDRFMNFWKSVLRLLALACLSTEQSQARHSTGFLLSTLRIISQH